MDINSAGPSGQPQKLYPIRRRINLKEAVNNINNWIDEEEFSEESESEFESSSEEEEMEPVPDQPEQPALLLDATAQFEENT